jgi:hypothetical protein
VQQLGSFEMSGFVYGVLGPGVHAVSPPEALFAGVELPFAPVPASGVPMTSGYAHPAQETRPVNVSAVRATAKRCMTRVHYKLRTTPEPVRSHGDPSLAAHAVSHEFGSIRDRCIAPDRWVEQEDPSNRG